MHLIERYATACGVKIGKPFIYEKFFPLPIQKYICFQPFSKYNSKNYDYWQEVLEILTPYLEENNIKIVQIGTKNDKQFVNTVFLGGQTTINQAAYVIKNSIIHLGADSFGVHIASSYDKKIVALYSNSNIENACPYWTKKQDKILISSNKDKKPSYSAEESSKSINNIKPEEIASSVLKLLNINTLKTFKYY
jgi:ADP-heptose:LPS heptosyltransferase